SNPEKSQVLVTGQGYNFDKEQENQFKKEQEKREEAQKKKKTEVNQNQSKADSGSDTITEEGTGDSGNKGEDESKLPVITTDLVSGRTYNGTSRGFWVKATDFKGRTIKMTEDGLFSVTANGNKLISTGGSNGEKVSYKLSPLLEGENSVKITVTDRYGNKSTVSYIINGNPEGEKEEEGFVEVIVEANTIGKGTIVSGREKVYVGDQGSELIDRFLKTRGFGYWNTGTLTNSFYLKAITKSGITNGYRIPEKLQAKLEEAGYTETAHESDSLGEKDFTQRSGWTMTINGTSPNTGLSAYVPKDGDTLILKYTLWDGMDVNGTWGSW
ncbi:MAG: DUF4430 domain-containing protein, partial [Anaerovoracaceae bacterium]